MTANIRDFCETDVELAAIQWFQSLGYVYHHGPSLNPERGGDPRQAILWTRLEASLRRLNPGLPADALAEAVRQVRRLDGPSLAENNLGFHRLFTRGVPVQVRRPDGSTRGETVWLADFDAPDRNDWVIANQLTLVGARTRRPDLIVYLNGLPVAVLELKDPTNPQARVKGAFHQLQTYKANVPQLFTANEILVASDGLDTRVGSLTAGWERFGPWRVIDGETAIHESTPDLQVTILGLFEKARLLEYLRDFILFETDDGVVKKIAGYHQFWAVREAVDATARAVAPGGDGRIGVVWHTQGSGKSISMVFYAGKVLRHPATANPTLVLITDRMDLDSQLFRQFARARDLIPHPEQAESRAHLRELLQVASGGVVFTTMQKFTTHADEVDYPQLTDRRNVIIIADEAHRTHYQFARGLADNLRRALPGASRIGFTGTPIEFEDRNTPAIFGEYIDVYPISQAVKDEATVPIYYESRLARLELPEDEKPKVDEEFTELTEDESPEVQRKLQSRWARLEALIRNKKRLKLIARDILEHWRKRSEAVAGKAMVTTISRKVAAGLYREIIRLRPDWHHDDVDKGALKVVITGSAADPASLQPHIHPRKALDRIAARLKDPDDPLEMVIVCDMWLTGFDAPPLHTLYIDKPLHGHALMQAIARVNRVFRDKPAGLVVDYLGVASELKKAVQWYDRGQAQQEEAGLPVELALEELRKRHDIVKAMFHGFDYGPFFGADKAARVQTLAAAEDHILGLEDGRKRYRENMTQLNRAVGLALHLEQARPLRNDVAFFQAVGKSLGKHTAASGEPTDVLDAAVRQIVSRAVVPDEEVLDLLGLAGVDKPEISILSEAFLSTIQVSRYTNLQVEALTKLLKDEVRKIERRNVVQGKRFSERLQEAINKYQNRALDAAAVVTELVELARRFREEQEQGKRPGLSESEQAFYDALADHGDVVQVMGDTVLADIARRLVETVRNSATLDWTQKESVRARLRNLIRIELLKSGYPPDKSEAAVSTVLHQAEAACADWGIQEALASATAPEVPPAADEEPPVTYQAPEPPVMVAADSSTLQGFVAGDVWSEALEETVATVHPFIAAARREGFPAPEWGWDWEDSSGRAEGSILELAWPEKRVAVLLERGVTERALEQMQAREWTVFRPPFDEDRFLQVMQ